LGFEDFDTKGEAYAAADLIVKKQRALLFGVSGEKVEDKHPNIIYEGSPVLDEFWYCISKGPPVLP